MGVALTLGQLGSLVYLLLIALLGDGDNLHTVGELGDTLGHDAVTHVQTRGHDVSLAVVLGVDGYLGIFHLVVLGHYIHEGLVLYLRAGLLRYLDGTLVYRGDDDGAGAAALQQLVGIG